MLTISIKSVNLNPTEKFTKIYKKLYAQDKSPKKDRAAVPARFLFTKIRDRRREHESR